MNNRYLERARQMIGDPQIISVVAGKRAKQLALGARPMVKCRDENHLDIALLEIAEGKIGYEFGASGDETPEQQDTEEAKSQADSPTEGDTA